MKKLLLDLWRIFGTDLLRKIVALMLAVVLYYGIFIQLQEEKIIRDVPIEIMTESGLLDAPTKQLVSVTVRGPRRMLNRYDLDGEKFAGKVMIGKKDRDENGGYTVRISPRIFREYNGVKVIGTSEKKLTFPLRLEITKEVDVKPLTSGKLDGDYELSSIHCTPVKVRVVGPEDIVNDLREISTEAVPLTPDVTTTFERYHVKIELPSGLSVTPQEVSVHCDILKKSEDYKIPQHPVTLKNLDRRWEMSLDDETPALVKVILTGTPSAIKEFKKDEDISIYPDISGIEKAGEYIVPLIVNITQSNVSVRQLDPKNIRVIVKEKKEGIFEKVLK